jgi:hypothetical protein
MPHKETSLRLQQILDEREKRVGDKIPKEDILEALDITSQTLSHYLLDRWSTVDRCMLERFADLAGCQVSDLFETRLSPFWDTFPKPSSSCYCVRLANPPEEEKENERVVSDDKALVIMRNLIIDCASHTKVFEKYGAMGQAFDDLLNDNLIVVGGPRSNPATDRALEKVFAGQEPPFQFVWHTGMGAPAGSFATSAASADGPVGIKLTEEPLIVEAKYIHNHAEFEQSSTRDGRDCAVVVVANRTSESDMKPRKLIILAGFSGVGTEGAARILADDFREMEPRNGEPYAWGIVEVIYRKTSNKPQKILCHYDWRYRSGGRNPIAFKKKRIGMQGGAHPVTKKASSER